jgi:hypothetical protein
MFVYFSLKAREYIIYTVEAFDQVIRKKMSNALPLYLVCTFVDVICWINREQKRVLVRTEREGDEEAEGMKMMRQSLGCITSKRKKIEILSQLLREVRARVDELDAHAVETTRHDSATSRDSDPTLLSSLTIDQLFERSFALAEKSESGKSAEWDAAYEISLHVEEIRKRSFKTLLRSHGLNIPNAVESVARGLDGVYEIDQREFEQFYDDALMLTAEVAELHGDELLACHMDILTVLDFRSRKSAHLADAK